jgi:uncharacterized protein with von Willebrand factor type A (vWA) domain
VRKSNLAAIDQLGKEAEKAAADACTRPKAGAARRGQGAGHAGGHAEWSLGDGVLREQSLPRGLLTDGVCSDCSKN